MVCVDTIKSLFRYGLFYKITNSRILQSDAYSTIIYSLYNSLLFVSCTCLSTRQKIILLVLSVTVFQMHLLFLKYNFASALILFFVASLNTGKCTFDWFRSHFSNIIVDFQIIFTVFWNRYSLSQIGIRNSSLDSRLVQMLNAFITIGDRIGQLAHNSFFPCFFRCRCLIANV